jgi:hypothetical protein
MPTHKEKRSPAAENELPAQILDMVSIDRLLSFLTANAYMHFKGRTPAEDSLAVLSATRHSAQTGARVSTSHIPISWGVDELSKV